jgi:xanthine dehydrogenase accessory factor
MSELSEILDAIESDAAGSKPMALATIVATRGSTYRRAGARLLVRSNSELVGNLSGGCLEGDVARIGREVMESGQPRMADFDLTAESDDVWGYGLGCNGAFEVFVEAGEGAMAAARVLREANDTCLVTVLTGPDAGSHRLQADGAAAAALRDATPRVVEEDGQRVFYEPLLPPLRLVVCAAGHDVIPLVRQAGELGWRVTVADIRRKLLTHERFPEATDFCDADPMATAGAVAPDRRTAVVLMSHNYLRDQEYLRSFLDADPPPAYLGVLGPRGRTEQMLHEMGRPDAMQRLHAPAGLDIGADGPEEIARSIIAEILAVMRGRSGGPLRDRRGSIHAG